MQLEPQTELMLPHLHNLVLPCSLSLALLYCSAVMRGSYYRWRCIIIVYVVLFYTLAIALSAGRALARTIANLHLVLRALILMRVSVR